VLDGAGCKSRERKQRICRASSATSPAAGPTLLGAEVIESADGLLDAQPVVDAGGGFAQVGEASDAGDGGGASCQCSTTRACR
jgi:hypothetical protein